MIVYIVAYTGVKNDVDLTTAASRR